MNKQNSFSNKTIEALKMAIEAMSCISQSRMDPLLKTIRACKEALAEAEQQEPVAIVMEDSYGYGASLYKRLPLGTKLYTHPATWQSLSDDEKWNLINNSDIPADYDHEVLAIAHAIDDKLKEKNKC